MDLRAAFSYQRPPPSLSLSLTLILSLTRSALLTLLLTSGRAGERERGGQRGKEIVRERAITAAVDKPCIKRSLESRDSYSILEPDNQGVTQQAFVNERR